MRRWLCIILFWLSLVHDAGAGIVRWDALPAVDVLHLQGPYAGSKVCPMCRHGYDAGLLVFLPSATSADDARRTARDLQAISSAIADERFRPFLILTGATPSAALLDAVRGPENRWYVAHLPDPALARASRDFAVALDRRAQGYVFAQRRLLLAFDPRQPPPQLAEHARHAMGFLHMTYARAVVSDDPDTPKGQLWTAPNQLSSVIAFTKRTPSEAARVCVFDDARSAQRDALVALTRPASRSPARTWWARTDGAGCLSLSGTQAIGRLHAVVFTERHDAAFGDIDANALQPGADSVLRVTSRAPTGVIGNEPIVGLPCEGCEAVFKDLPSMLSASGRIADVSEPGESLVLSGTVRDRDGLPQAGVVLHAYQTDRNGRYSTDPHASGTPARHARLRGWVRTDARGRYAFRTVRPGSYPEGSEPQHIHMHVIEPGRCTYHLGDVLFDDDPLLVPALRSKEHRARGGNGIVHAIGDADAGWQATRDITLGLNVDGHAACSSGDPTGRHE